MTTPPITPAEQARVREVAALLIERDSVELSMLKAGEGTRARGYFQMRLAEIDAALARLCPAAVPIADVERVLHLCHRNTFERDFRAGWASLLARHEAGRAPGYVESCGHIWLNRFEPAGHYQVCSKCNAREMVEPAKRARHEAKP